MVKFEGYGKNVMKAHKASPDAWAQMVKQLAFYRLNGRPPVVYESCQTRKFLLGRTEVIRSSSPESKAFCEAMMSSSSSDSDREKKFREAVRRHIQYSTWAADGQGVDRHMFGLKKLLQDGEKMPEVFEEGVHAKSSHWELSTSQLSSNYLEGWGYGEGESFLLPASSSYLLLFSITYSQMSRLERPLILYSRGLKLTISCRRRLRPLLRNPRRSHQMVYHNQEQRC